ncbi:MAG: prephenate dehydrogenase [Chitinophagia bacterium]|nr:prephenate dehydrogenase [Chitinophagia bacterium]
MRVTIIGVGLIGGSIALTLKSRKFADQVIGVDANTIHAEKAIELGIVDVMLPWKEAVKMSDMIILATPIDVTESMLPALLEMCNNQIVLDVGSTKKNLCEKIERNSKRGRFVATHPMWGTEFSGPQSALNCPFDEKATVICDREKSDPDALEKVEQLYKVLGMKIIYMNSDEHDLHVAYVSHISHITSFALANTVLEKEKEEDTIFGLASGGFESTVRLAKSNPSMWIPIFMQNRENVLDVLNEHIAQLRKFKTCLEKENYEYLGELINRANEIRRILK